MIALSQTRPKVDTPCRRPTGGLIATDLQRPFDGGRKVGSPEDIDVMSREKTIKVRYMPMMNFRRFHVPILEPFLQLPGVANPHRRQTRARGRPLLLKI